MKFYMRKLLLRKKTSDPHCHDNPYSFILNEKPVSLLSVHGAKEIVIELNS
jgi:hypothetical protein